MKVARIKIIRQSVLILNEFFNVNMATGSTNISQNPPCEGYCIQYTSPVYDDKDVNTLHCQKIGVISLIDEYHPILPNWYGRFLDKYGQMIFGVAPLHVFNTNFNDAVRSFHDEAQRQGLCFQEIRIMDHGKPGVQDLGKTVDGRKVTLLVTDKTNKPFIFYKGLESSSNWLEDSSEGQSLKRLASINPRGKKPPDIILNGCQVGQGRLGTKLLQGISRFLSGVPVSASTTYQNVALPPFSQKICTAQECAMEYSKKD